MAGNAHEHGYEPTGWRVHYPAGSGTAVAAALECSHSSMKLVPADRSDARGTDTTSSGIAIVAQQLTADDADALDQSATSEGVQTFPLKLEEPGSTIVRKDWTADEAAIVET